MGRKPSYRKSTVSPLPMASLSPSPSPHESPDETLLNTTAAGASTSKSKSRIRRIDGGTNGSNIVASPPGKNLTSITDLKELASSGLDDLKRHLDRSHSEILKDFEASHSRLHKRFKMHTQSCQQLMDKVDEEYKRISEQIGETQRAMKDTYREFMDDAQATTSRLCKTSIPELQRSFEKAIDDLRCRSGLSSA